MSNYIFLFSMPGGSEWILLIPIVLILIVCPVLAIIYYREAKRLRKENKELLGKLLEKNR